MDRDLNALAAARPFSYRRLFATIAVAAAIITIGSLLVRLYPNSGYESGQDAVLEKGTSWVQGEVAAANGTSLSACELLHRETEGRADSPRYEYDSFVAGCDKAVDDLIGHDVPLLPSGG